jgi:hypothetical protein
MAGTIERCSEESLGICVIAHKALEQHHFLAHGRTSRAIGKHGIQQYDIGLRVSGRHEPVGRVSLHQTQARQESLHLGLGAE